MSDFSTYEGSVLGTLTFMSSGSPYHAIKVLIIAVYRAIVVILHPENWAKNFLASSGVGGKSPRKSLKCPRVRLASCRPLLSVATNKLGIIEVEQFGVLHASEPEPSLSFRTKK